MTDKIDDGYKHNISQEDSIDDGGPAFPELDSMGDGHGGMSLRDWFAGHALIGLLSGQFQYTSRGNLTDLPNESFYIADAMIASRKKP